MEHVNDHSHCNCHLTNTNESVHQTLSEMDWERGLWNAAFTGDSHRVKQLIDKAKNAKVFINTPDNSGYYALHYAARSGHNDICKILLTNGAFVDVQTRSGKATPLHKAATTGKITTLKILLEHGANIELQDADGKTVLHKAAENNHNDLVHLILKEHPKLRDIKDFKGKFALQN